MVKAVVLKSILKRLWVRFPLFLGTIAQRLCASLQNWLKEVRFLLVPDVFSCCKNFGGFKVPLLVSIAFITLAERKALGLIQVRRGPNLVGFVGLFLALMLKTEASSHVSISRMDPVQGSPPACIIRTKNCLLFE